MAFWQFTQILLFYSIPGTLDIGITLLDPAVESRLAVETANACFAIDFHLSPSNTLSLLNFVKYITVF